MFAGYGPICAEKFGLPWDELEGDAKKQAMKDALADWDLGDLAPAPDLPRGNVVKLEETLIADILSLVECCPDYVIITPDTEPGIIYVETKTEPSFKFKVTIEEV